jgi:hypothetical protein
LNQVRSSGDGIFLEVVATPAGQSQTGLYQFGQQWTTGNHQRRLVYER